MEEINEHTKKNFIIGTLYTTPYTIVCANPYHQHTPYLTSPTYTVQHSPIHRGVHRSVHHTVCCPVHCSVYHTNMYTTVYTNLIEQISSPIN